MVEQPIAARQVTGSNPVGPFRLSVWLNWIEYLTTDQKVPGSSPGSDKHMVAWPSGLRRQLKALVREGVGSNPTAIIQIWASSFCPSIFLLSYGPVTLLF